MSSLEPKQRWTLGIGAALLTLLLSAVFTFGSLDVPFEPKSWREAMALYTVSSFITAALLVFLLILTRTVLRLWAERSKEQLGARFKTKMVVGAMALSLLPVLFMFFVSYSLLNRTLGRWFPRPLEIASEQTQNLLNDLGRTSMLPRLRSLARQVQSNMSLPTVDVGNNSACVAAGYRTSPDFLNRFTLIQTKMREYETEKQNLRALKTQMLLILAFFTILLLFSVMWLALFLAKQVTVPIQALAEGTREVSAGNFDYQVPEQAQDELG